jgi:uncharacterized protein (TIGR02186 family)
MKRLALQLSMIVLAVAAGDARAERLISSLSSHQVMIGSSFTGMELVLFGSIERDAATVPRRGGYDIVVTVLGPRETLVARKKERTLGIWTNAQTQAFDNAPSYLAVLSNRLIDRITAPDLQRRYEIGLVNVPLLKDGARLPAEREPFRQALIALMSKRGLYREEENAVTFLTPNLFRTGIVLPAEAAVGNYEVNVKLFADGVLIARTTSALEIVKVGVEQFVASAARDHALLYGFGVMGMALATGWFASLIFRRD